MRALGCTPTDLDVARLLNQNTDAVSPTQLGRVRETFAKFGASPNLPSKRGKIMNLSLIEIIKILEKQGHEIEYSKRKDGGYIIRGIDGAKFSGKVGNAFARRLVGAKLSQARQVQLAKIRLPKGKKYEKMEELPDNLKKMLRKVQREWRKKHPTIEGTMTTRGVRYHLRHYGLEETLRSLDKGYRYASGYAYIDNVNWLIERINQDLISRPSAEMEQVVELIKRKTLDFREEWISACYQVIYDWEKGAIDDRECARQIRAIIS